MSKILWLLFLLPIQPLASCEQGADDEEATLVVSEAPSKYKDLQVDLKLPPEDEFLAEIRQDSLNEELESLSTIEMRRLIKSGKKYEKTPDGRATKFFRFGTAEQFCKHYKIDINSIDVFELLHAAGKARTILDEFTNALDQKIMSNELLSSKEYDKMMDVYVNVCEQNRYKGCKIFDLTLIQKKIAVLAKRIQFEET